MRTGARGAERQVEGAVSRGGEVQAEGAPAAGLGVGGAQPCQRYTARLPVTMEHSSVLYSVADPDPGFFLPLSFVAVFGSGIRDPRSGIRDPGWVKIRVRDPG